jgi:mRNA turnover protein 4
MAKALGTNLEEEHRPGLAPIASVSDRTIRCSLFALIQATVQQIKGQVGLLFTDTEPQEVVEWFKDFHQPDFARSGNRATRTVILPAGPIMQHHSHPPEPFPHNEEPQLRKLGLTTVMRRGIPTLENPHKICEKGNVLTTEQAQLLKLIGEKMVTFRVGLRARWDSATGEVEDVADPGVKLDVDGDSGGVETGSPLGAGDDDNLEAISECE